MRRRDFITLVGGAAAAQPLLGHAQQPGQPLIGFLSAGAPAMEGRDAAAFRRGLSEAGYIEGQNITIEYRWANFQVRLLAELAANLVRHRPNAIVATGATSAALAVKSVTSTIPIVFVSGGDPVKYGLVASLNRPGGNLTGVTFVSSELTSKRLGL
jgi:putative tryptophan/tyrosine transport system substrate-binding protein